MGEECRVLLAPISIITTSTNSQLLNEVICRKPSKLNKLLKPECSAFVLDEASTVWTASECDMDMKGKIQVVGALKWGKVGAYSVMTGTG